MNQESSEYFRVPNPGDFAGLASPDRASARHEELAGYENAVPEWMTQARRSIRDNPLGAVVTALAAGLLFRASCGEAMSRASPTSFKEPGETPDSLMDTLRSLWHDIPRLLSDRMELLSLELHRAGLALLQIVVLGISLAVVGITAWLILWSLIITGLTLVGLHWMGAFALALAVHVVIGAWLVLRVKTLLPKLRLPATRRHLMFSSSPVPVTPPPRTHEGLPTERSDHDRVLIP